MSGNGRGEAKIRAFAKQPRGALGTFARLEGGGTTASWLRERNSLLTDFGRDGRTRILVCENGTCREEDPGEVEEEEGGEGGAAAAAAVLQETNTKSEAVAVVAKAESGEKEEQRPVREGGDAKLQP